MNSRQNEEKLKKMFITTKNKEEKEEKIKGKQDDVYKRKKQNVHIKRNPNIQKVEVNS